MLWIVWLENGARRCTYRRQMTAQPKSRAKTKPAQQKAQKLLDANEIERLRVWAIQALVRGERTGALVVALLGTAGRRFEVAALRCQDIRIGTGGPEVFFPEIKGGGTATVPISDETYHALQGWCAGRSATGPLIPTESGEFMHPATLWREWKAALRAAGITRQVGVHAARHAAGYLLLRATNDITKVRVFLHHRSIATTHQWYTHVHLPDLRAGLTKAGL
jgi:site-specific recombinase XerD